MISVRSRKAKGRKLQQWVRDELLKVFPSLNNNDVQSAIMELKVESYNNGFVMNY